MMISTNYSEIVTKARANGQTVAHFDQPDYKVQAIPGSSDSFTLSDRAKAKMHGEAYSESAPTYVKPQIAADLLNQEEPTKAVEKNSYFDEMLQSILDKRLGIDREKLEEIEAMMEEVAKNENLSEEEKQKQLELLQQMKEEVIKESRDNKQQVSMDVSQHQNT
ncbi:hypothetical protein [Thalassotalea marina]|uniref:Uncharacterized protein n=1 Tax=Thalassotalea marina TaxID=1673741 RepID=A0A919BKM1_9GAMM|nr:hypothetical protein [Thalassotalea marina]GHF93709.1 hypothetical protein GCM10017161_22780 [Thalassotalea marina]